MKFKIKPKEELIQLLKENPELIEIIEEEVNKGLDLKFENIVYYGLEEGEDE